ncbi:MAG: hypothetical protein WCT03_25420 [Candidatus Obscuribacterales bacterium]|jgi:hypothetical protein
MAPEGDATLARRDVSREVEALALVALDDVREVEEEEVSEEVVAGEVAPDEVVKGLAVPDEAVPDEAETAELETDKFSVGPKVEQPQTLQADVTITRKAIDFCNCII